MQRLPSFGFFLGLTILVGSAVVGWIVFPKILQKKISENVRLVNGSETYKRWRDVPVPIYMKFYLFNVTNPHDVVVGKKPILTEAGPYVFRQKRQKYIIKINDNDTLTYRQTKTYFFEPDLSVGPLTDQVTVINLPLLGIAHKASKYSAFLRSLLLEYIPYDETVFVTRSVDEMLFKGYFVGMMEDISGLLGYKLLPNDTFGLYYGKNGSDQGVYEVHSGVEDTSKFGIIASWNGDSEMPFWKDEECRKIKGTDGSIFPPFVTTDRTLEMFSSDLCRSLRLVYEKDSLVNGISSYKFVVDLTQLEDPVFNRDNMCYCTQPGKRFSNCPKQGAYQINACRKETPLLVSLPHFLDGAQEYIDAAEGLNPIREKHETYIELEPTSGLLLKAAKRIQMNIEFRPFKFIKQLKKVPKMLLPIVWVDESAGMTPDGQQRLKEKLLKPKSYANYGAWAGVVLGLIIILVAALIYLIRARKKNYAT